MATQCTHLDQIKIKPHKNTRLRRMRQNRGFLGPLTPLPNMRARRMLRFFQEQARYKALPQREASPDPLDRAR